MYQLPYVGCIYDRYLRRFYEYEFCFCALDLDYQSFQEGLIIDLMLEKQFSEASGMFVSPASTFRMLMILTGLSFFCAK